LVAVGLVANMSMSTLMIGTPRGEAPVDHFIVASVIDIAADGGLLFGVVVSAWTHYLHDQRVARAVASCVVPFAGAGSVVMRSMLEYRRLEPTLGPCAGAFLLLYPVLIFSRRRRVLPPGLAGTRFVRLGFLRKSLREGRRIQRSQDFPVDASGDVTKASYLVIVSHRWLDRMGCDVDTPEFPHAFRLTTMVRRLEARFLSVGMHSGS